jgi:hypothetical protein
MTQEILHRQGQRAKARRPARPLTTTELQQIIARWDDGGGVTAAVQAFADAVPVAEWTVWYWLGGRMLHRARTERIRSLTPPKTRTTNRREHP